MTDALCIAIIHYHLRPGGVTTVIKETVRSLQTQGCRVAVLSGTRADVQVPGVDEHEGVPGLDYTDRSPEVLPETLVENLEAAARRSFGHDPDIWHFHNHSLGKNGMLSQAVYCLAGRGRRMLLQIHDFPEDGRPSNYRGLLQHLGESSPTQLSERLYPQGGLVHYATINRRDHEFLCRAGVEPRRAHLLPNAVTLPPAGEPIPQGGKRLFIYPTRAIRRKNLGEFLLRAALAEKNDRFATTLAPTSAEDRAPYERWVRVADSLGLPVDFEVGLRSPVPLGDLLRSAHAVVTTSVAEGFGLAFLEPWLVGRPLLGRDLPELTEGFKKQGLNLDSLYGKLPVPLAWIGANVVRARIESAMRSMLLSYGRELGEETLTRAYEAAVEGMYVDFGRLDENLQEEVLRRVARDPACGRELERSSGLGPKPEAALVEANRRLIEREYNGDQYGKRLMQIYHQLMNAEQDAAEALNAESLLDSFLAPERFFLLRS